MNVLVTGGAGYIGSVVVEQLLRHGHRAIVYDSLSASPRAAVQPDTQFVPGELAEKENLIAAFRNS